MPGGSEAAYNKSMSSYRQLWTLAPNYVQSHHQAGLVHLKMGSDHRRQFDELRTHGRMADAQVELQKAKTSWGDALVEFHKYHEIDPVFEPKLFAYGLGSSPVGRISSSLKTTQRWRNTIYPWPRPLIMNH